MEKTYYNAIVIEPVLGEKPLAHKYRHNITDKYLPKFVNDMQKKFPLATHINFYNKKTRVFYKQVQLYNSRLNSLSFNK